MTSMDNGLREVNRYLRLRNEIIGYRSKLERELEAEVEQEIIQAGQSIPKRLEDLKEAVKKAKAQSTVRSSIIDFDAGDSGIKRIEQAKRDIVSNALNIIQGEIKCQVAAIFVISKDGILRRIGLIGNDKNGALVDDDWLEDEIYEVSKSFTGAAVSKDALRQERYGEIKYSSNLDSFNLDLKNKSQYMEKFGSLREAIALPLNGRNRTYGVLRVINKEGGFSPEDVSRLGSLADSTATALSNFRRDIENAILRYLSRLLIQANSDTKLIYQEIADLLARNPETPYKSCIIRTSSEAGESFHIKALSLWDNVSSDRDNGPLFINDGRLPEQVLKTGKRLVIRNIRSKKHIDKFANQKWIMSNNLDSYGCFPLTVKDETIGTISLYTGFNYEFHPDSVIFIQHFADSLASFIYRVRQDRYFRRLQRLQRSDINDSSSPQRERIGSHGQRTTHWSTHDDKLARSHRSHSDLAFKHQGWERIRDSLFRIILVLLIWSYLLFRIGILGELSPPIAAFLLVLMLTYLVCETLYSGIVSKIKALK